MVPPERQRDLSESEALARAGLTTDDVEHCASCHEDSNDGYPMSNVTFAADRAYAEVCCDVSSYLRALDGLVLTPHWWQ